MNMHYTNYWKKKFYHNFQWNGSACKRHKSPFGPATHLLSYHYAGAVDGPSIASHSPSAWTTGWIPHGSPNPWSPTLTAGRTMCPSAAQSKLTVNCSGGSTNPFNLQNPNGGPHPPL